MAAEKFLQTEISRPLTPGGERVSMLFPFPKILVDDTRSPTIGTYGPALACQVAEIAKCQVNRHNAYAWARNLRFLVYDDEDDGEDEKEQNRDLPDENGAQDREMDEEEKQMQQAIALSMAAEKQDDIPEPEFETDQEREDYAIAMSLQESEEAPTEEIEASSAGQKKKKAAAGSSHPRSCNTCKRYVRFPYFKRPTKFRVLKFKPEDLAHVRICDHYAAVSYCWRSDSTGTAATAEKSYRIRVQDEDGNYVERTNRAPNEVIDRAVDAARAAGFRLVWIDQECLPQDGGREHELGIQAMDMVYQRAQFTIGLFESTIPKQAHLESVAAVLLWGVRKKRDPNAVLAQRRPGVPLREFCINLIEFLELLADDLWNSRAWILQDAFSSAEDLAIFIKTAPGVKFYHPPEDIFDKPQSPNWIDGAFTLFVRDILRIIKVSKDFLMKGVVRPGEFTEARMNSLVEHGNDTHTADWYERAAEVLERLDRLFPIPAATTNRHAFMFAIGGANFGPRKTCNAAVALYFLRTRLNHRPADRLAILANLCDYEIRLDTNAIETQFKSLSLCLVTLAIINGDLSLLVPGVYENWRIQAHIQGPSWALPFPEILHSIDMTTLRAGYNLTLRNSNRYSLSDSGLTLPAALWNVNRMVDLTPIKLHWASEWRKFSCLEIEIEWQEKETADEHSARRAEVLRQVQESYSNMDTSKRSLSSLNYEWDFEPDPALGAQIKRVVAASHANGIPQLQSLLSRIFVDIMLYLCNSGERYLANSIWHSIRMDCASVDQNSRFNWADSNLDALPDNVEELLMNQKLISNLWLALQLDPNDHGNLSQMWFIHRIMKDGFLWAGHYVLAPTQIPEIPPNLQHMSALFSQPPKPHPNILQSQTTQQLMACELKKDFYKIERDDSEAAEKGVTLGWSVSVMYKTSLEEFSWAREARFRPQVAAFDVDGPCLVAVPFDSDMERLPRPSIRSMAAAWIVERVSSCNGDEDVGEELDPVMKDEELPASSLSGSEIILSNGVESEPTDQIFDGIPDDDSSNQAPIDKGKGRMKEEEPSKTEAVDEGEKFKVVGRVMGVWEIMEEPTNQYTFV